MSHHMAPFGQVNSKTTTTAVVVVATLPTTGNDCQRLPNDEDNHDLDWNSVH